MSVICCVAALWFLLQYWGWNSFQVSNHRIVYLTITVLTNHWRWCLVYHRNGCDVQVQSCWGGVGKALYVVQGLGTGPLYSGDPHEYTCSQPQPCTFTGQFSCPGAQPMFTWRSRGANQSGYHRNDRQQHVLQVSHVSSLSHLQVSHVSSLSHLQVSHVSSLSHLQVSHVLEERPPP